MVYCSSTHLRGFLDWNLLHGGTRWLEIIWRCKYLWVFGLAAVPAVSAKQWKGLCVEQACSQQLLYVAAGAGPGAKGGLLMLLSVHDFPCLLLWLQLVQVSPLALCL